MASYDTTGQQDDQTDKNREKRRNQGPMTFKELMCLVCGQDVDCCGCPIPNYSDDIADWLDKFRKANSCKTPTQLSDTLIAELMLPGHAITGINISSNKVNGNLDGATYPEKFFKAFAMATIAAGNENMRNNGVDISGDTPEEMVIMFLAASYLGLKVMNADDQIKAQAQQAHQQMSGKLWEDFKQAMHDYKPPVEKYESEDSEHDTQPEEDEKPDDSTEAENKQESEETPDAESLTDIFNRQIPDNIKAKLQSAKVAPEVYQHISDDIVKTQDARRNTLAQKYKDAFNLTHAQLDNIVKAMDEEGITSLQHGNRRVINFNSDGKPKAPGPT